MNDDLTSARKTRLVFTVMREEADNFEKQLHDVGLQPKRATVAAQSAEEAAVEVVKIIVALGGGAGIALIIQRMGAVIARIIHDKRKIVKLNGRSFENMNAEEITAILKAEAKIPRKTISETDRETT